MALAAHVPGTWDELLTKEVSFALTGHDDVLYTDTQIVKNMFGARINTVAGYTGTNEIRLAMERGEVQGTCGKVFQAAGVALPPTIQQVTPTTRGEDAAHSATSPS